MIKIKRYKKGSINDAINRRVIESTVLKDWTVIQEKEVGGYSAGTGCLLGLLFLPLLALGASKYIEVTYEKKEEINSKQI